MDGDARERADAEVAEAERRMERRARELEERTEGLGEQVEKTKSDWQRKRTDPNVPGANPPDADENDGGDVAGDWEGQGPAADEAGQ